jgi:hypothetical protein
MILAVTKVTAQDTFVVFEGASHVYTVDKHDPNTYKWSVYLVTDLDNEILTNSIVEFVSGKDSNSSTIKWNQTGEYVLVLEEFGNCQNMKAKRVSVINTATIAFKDLTSEDCADEINDFATELVAMFDSGTVLPESQYPITLKYRITGDSDDRTATINFADRMLNVLGIIEDENVDKTYDIIIKSAVNKYGGTLNVVTGNENHIRSLYALPQMTPISIK